MTTCESFIQPSQFCTGALLICGLDEDEIEQGIDHVEVSQVLSGSESQYSQSRGKFWQRRFLFEKAKFGSWLSGHSCQPCRWGRLLSFFNLSSASQLSQPPSIQNLEVRLMAA